MNAVCHYEEVLDSGGSSATEQHPRAHTSDDVRRGSWLCHMDASDLLLGCVQDKDASRGSWDLQRNVGLRGQNLEVRVTMISG